MRKHKPKTSEEAGQLAEDFIQAGQPLTQTTTRAAPRGERPPPPGKCPRCGKEGHWARDCPKARAGGPPLPREHAAKPEREAAPSRCFHCQQRGHFAANCPNNATLYCEGEDKSSVDASAPHQGEKGIFRRGVVDGVYIKDILLDTGASRSMIREDILPPDHRVDGEVTIRCAHGDMVAYPLTAIAVDIGSRRFVVKAGVSRTLPVPVLLGRDVPELLQLLEGESSTAPEPQESETEDVLAATTRAQERRRENEAALIQAREQDDSARASPVHVAHQGATEVTQWCELDDSLFSPSGRPERPRMSRRQHRENNRLYVEGATERSSASPTPQVLDLTSLELQRLQEEDVTLEAARRMAKGEPGLAGNDFFLRNGLLYRRYSPPGSYGDEAMTTEQLVLPTQCRRPVLRLAHDIPLAGHLGKNKTSRRILQRFFWPSLHHDVAQYCRMCPECQKASPRRAKRAPLIPLPVMDVPFRCIAMDIVGPLPRSRSAKRFILVICDYATRYPEAIPVRSIDTETVAEELLTFSQVGVPEEVLTDQGTNFTSRLLSEVYRLLHVQPIRTSPYHPQTDGLVERFNQTLKSMLRKAATEEGKDWDRLIPYLLFAYREVPQASTGFSPFKLLYSRHVRGPLDVLRETWEASRQSNESVVSYVMTVQERLAKLSELVRDNLTQAQQTQKAWYDRHARNREFQPGDHVLVLLPTCARKLLAEWQGPYPVLRRVGQVSYEVDMMDRKKRKRIFHVNMLRKWEIQDDLYMTEEVYNRDDIVPWADDSGGERPTVGIHLSPQQASQLDGLLQEFDDVLQAKPGRTDLAEHCIDVGRARPIRLAPYRLPHAYHETVREKLEDMERTGIIER